LQEISKIAALAIVVLAACSPPENTAISSRSLVAGEVFEGVLVRTDPIFVDSSQLTRYNEAIGSLAEISRLEDVVNPTSVQFQLARTVGMLTNSIAAEAEINIRSMQCQFYIDIVDSRLASTIGPSTFFSSRERFRQEELFRELRTQQEQLNSNRQRLEQSFQLMNQMEMQRAPFAGLPNTKLDNNATETNSVQPLIESREAYRAALEELILQGQRRIEELTRQAQMEVIATEERPKTVAIINPCRDFEPGQKLFIVDYGQQYVLQPALTTAIQ